MTGLVSGIDWRGWGCIDWQRIHPLMEDAVWREDTATSQTTIAINFNGQSAGCSAAHAILHMYAGAALIGIDARYLA